MALAGITAVLMSSCKKDNPVPLPSGPINSGSGIASFFQSNLENEKQTFTINADNTSTVTGSKGTTVTFYPHSFVNQSGAYVSGNVQIELIEIYNKKDMILLNKQTMGVTGTGLGLLVSGGEFNIVAKQNGQKLKLAPGMGYSLTAPAPNGTTPEMTLFYGDVDEDGQLTWTQEQGDSVMIDMDQNTYYAYFDSIDWVNLDYFMGMSGPQTIINVQLPAQYTLQNTSVFISIDGYNSVAGIYNFQSGFFTTGPYYQLPVNMNVHFVILNIEDDVIKAAVIPATITNDHIEVVTELNTVTESELSTLLGNLP